MKQLNIFCCISLLCLLTACQEQSTLDIVARQNPIKPIRLTQDTTEIDLTDYIPMIVARGELQTTGFSQLYTVADKGKIDVLHLHDRNNGFCIAVLPNKPLSTGMWVKAAGKDYIDIAFADSVTPIQLVAFVQNCRIRPEQIQDLEDGSFRVSISSRFEGRSYVRVYAETQDQLLNDLLIPLENGTPVTSATQLNRHDDEAQVLYSLMVDRFCNGNTNNDQKLNNEEVLDIVDYQGGDLAGITQQIEAGFFDSLGINTIWISPITQNPWDAWGRYPFQELDANKGLYNCKYDSTRAYTKFSGYHGYWPVFVTALDKRFGNDEELRKLLDTAHKHNMNVILDYVANHMHIQSPTLQEHPDWITDSILPDGRRNFELWDEQRLTTWFDVHIPTLDLEKQEVCDAMTDSALYWLQNYDFDGFRHDACKHIPEQYWRMLAQKINDRFPNRHIWMIGETYGGPDLINRYVKSGMLNAQFDFNIFWTARNCFAYGESFEQINRTILESMATYGCHHTMGNISGNHDQVRFISLADGAVARNENEKEAGWTRNIRPATELAYIRAMQLEVLNLTIPGVPCIYQGDEYGEIGANDPDNRHVMRFDGLTDREQEYKDKVQLLIDLRRHSMALTYGEYVPLTVTPDTLEFERRYMDEIVRVKIVRDQISEINY